MSLFAGALLYALALSMAGGQSVSPSPSASTAAPSSLKLPDAIDLRPLFEKWKLEPRRQGGRGTCSVFTVTGALEFAVANRQQQGVRLSVEFLNWAGHKAANRTVD